jgi:hypothetical protein
MPLPASSPATHYDVLSLNSSVTIGRREPKFLVFLGVTSSMQHASLPFGPIPAESHVASDGVDQRRQHVRRILPPDVRKAIVQALATALVADYLQAAPRAPHAGRVRESSPARGCALRQRKRTDEAAFIPRGRTRSSCRRGTAGAGRLRASITVLQMCDILAKCRRLPRMPLPSLTAL